MTRSFLFSEILVDKFAEHLERKLCRRVKASLVSSAEGNISGWTEETNAASPACLVDFESTLVGTFLQFGFA